MKRAIFAAMFYLLSFSNHAYDESFVGTIGPVLKVSQLGDGVITTLGGRVSTTLINMLLLGMEGHGAVAQNRTLAINGRIEDISYYYGALGAGVRFFPESFIHLTNYNSFGLGQLSLNTSGKKGMVFNIEPELNLEVDLFSLMRVGAGVSYRLLFAKSLNLASATDLFGMGGQVFIEFGWL